MSIVVNFITGNANKLREVKAILEPAITVRSQAIDIEEVQGTVEEVTLAKCREAAEIVSATTLPHLCPDLCPDLLTPSAGQRPRSRGRYLSLLQSPRRPAWPVHVERPVPRDHGCESPG